MQLLGNFGMDKPGRLAAVTKKLYEESINIRAISIAEVESFRIVRLIVDNTDYAHSVLKDNGFTVSISKVIGVEVKDSSGELYRIAEVLGNEQINVKYCYASISGNEKAMLIFWVDNIKKAVKVLDKEGITLKGEPV